MNNITNKLDQLEARLQTLIEGHIARLLPAQLSKDDLMNKLVAAMQVGAQLGKDGNYLAPDTFFIQLNPQHITGLPSQEALLEELADLLQQAGDQADFQFARPPIINLIAEPEMGFEDSDIVARINNGVHDETLAIDMQADDEGAANVPPNAFMIVNGSQVFNLEATVINIGRKSDNELVIDDPRISRQHAQIRATRGRYVIFDLDSTGGTFVNGRRVTQCTLHPRDEISLAGVPLVYAQDELAADETQQYNPPKGYDDEHPTKGGMV